MRTYILAHCLQGNKLMNYNSPISQTFFAMSFFLFARLGCVRTAVCIHRLLSYDKIYSGLKTEKLYFLWMVARWPRRHFFDIFFISLHFKQNLKKLINPRKVHVQSIKFSLFGIFEFIYYSIISHLILKD